MLSINFNWVVPFFNSAFFAGLATILTGIVAYLIFLKQKSDERLRAARIIMVEIGDCENLFDSIKSNGVINLSNIRQLPFENNWNRYKHLFAKLLDGRDLKLIDNFYTACVLINKELEEAYSLPDYWQEKGRIIAERHAGYSEKSSNKEQYEVFRNQTKFFEEDDYWWQPFAPQKQITDRIKSLQYVTITPTGERMKNIAKL